MGMELEEKKDDSTEKEEGGKDEKKKKEKKEKEKKEKKVKVPKEKGPSCIDTLSTGLDLTARDGRGINTEINLDFDDVLAEPRAIKPSSTRLWRRILAGSTPETSTGR